MKKYEGTGELRKHSRQFHFEQKPDWLGSLKKCSKAKKEVDEFYQVIVSQADTIIVTIDMITIESVMLPKTAEIKENK